MAIAFDNASTGTVASNTVLTYSATVGVGSNRILLVAFVKHGCPGDITGTTTITYNGASLTYLGKGAYAACPAHVYVYYMVNPSSGANNVVISTGGSNSAIYSAWASYSGVSQSSPIDGFVEHSPGAQSNSVSASHTVTAANCWGISCALTFNMTCAEVDANQGVLTTKRSCHDDGVAIGDTNGTVSTGSVTMGWDRNTAGNSFSGLVNLSLTPAADIAPALSGSIGRPGFTNRLRPRLFTPGQAR